MIRYRLFYKSRHYSLGEILQRIYQMLINHFLGDETGILKLDQLFYLLALIQILGVLQIKA